MKYLIRLAQYCKKVASDPSFLANLLSSFFFGTDYGGILLGLPFIVALLIICFMIIFLTIIKKLSPEQIFYLVMRLLDKI